MLKWQDNRKTMSTCHRKNVDLKSERQGASILWQKIPFQSETRWHRYTCNWDSPESIERLDRYCKENSNSISKPWWTGDNSCWMEWLKCHICECAEWMTTDKNWRCCENWNTDKDWICCKDWKIPNADWICEEKPAETTTSEEQPLWWLEWTENQWQNQENNENKCPPQLQDSKWNCCKKMYYDLELEKEVCCEWILLSTNVPFIGQCIVYRKTDEPQPEAWLVVDETNAFPILMWWLSKIMVSIILLSSFIGLLVAWVMISASGSSEEGAKTWRRIIGNIIAALAILGVSGVILRLINPNFFW